MQNKTLSALVGLFVVAALAALAWLGLRASNINGYRSTASFPLNAYFRDISGLGRNAKVTLAGVQIGRVKSISIAPDHNYDALVQVEIDASYEKQLPDDSSLEILTIGLLGEKYLGLTLGGSETFLGANDEIRYTGSSVVLEKLIQQVVAQMGMNDNKNNKE